MKSVVNAHRHVSNWETEFSIENIVRFLPPKSPDVQKSAEKIWSWFGAEWQDALLLLGPEILLDPLHTEALNHYVEDRHFRLLDVAESVLADWELHPEPEFKELVMNLRDSKGRLRLSREEFQELHQIWLAIDPVRQEGMGSQRKKILKEFIEEAIQKKGISMADIKDQNIWEIYLARTRRLRPDMAIEGESYRFENLSAASARNEVHIPLMPGMILWRETGSITHFDEQNGRWKVFNLLLQDDELIRLLDKSGILERSPEGDEIHLGTVVYKPASRRSRADLKLLQSWYRLNEEIYDAGVRNGQFTKLEDPEDELFREKLKKLGRIDELLESHWRTFLVEGGYKVIRSPASHQIFGNTMLALAAYTAHKLNRLYDRAGYEPVLRNIPNALTGQRSKWGGYYWWEKNLSDARSTRTAT